ncbi:hypothetical protein HK405_006586 [Cladochytrium tenue]|nr:hypothetical protein HK405_006586 [Cladochytrium tenue]
MPTTLDDLDAGIDDDDLNDLLGLASDDDDASASGGGKGANRLSYGRRDLGVAGVSAHASPPRFKSDASVAPSPALEPPPPLAIANGGGRTDFLADLRKETAPIKPSEGASSLQSRRPSGIGGRAVDDILGSLRDDFDDGPLFPPPKPVVAQPARSEISHALGSQELSKQAPFVLGTTLSKSLSPSRRESTIDRVLGAAGLPERSPSPPAGQLSKAIGDTFASTAASALRDTGNEDDNLLDILGLGEGAGHARTGRRRSRDADSFSLAGSASPPRARPAASAAATPALTAQAPFTTTGGSAGPRVPSPAPAAGSLSFASGRPVPASSTTSIFASSTSSAAPLPAPSFPAASAATAGADEFIPSFLLEASSRRRRRPPIDEPPPPPIAQDAGGRIGAESSPPRSPARSHAPERATNFEAGSRQGGGALGSSPPSRKEDVEKASVADSSSSIASFSALDDDEDDDEDADDGDDDGNDNNDDDSRAVETRTGPVSEDEGRKSRGSKSATSSLRRRASGSRSETKARDLNLRAVAQKKSSSIRSDNEGAEAKSDGKAFAAELQRLKELVERLESDVKEKEAKALQSESAAAAAEARAEELAREKVDLRAETERLEGSIKELELKGIQAARELLDSREKAAADANELRSKHESELAALKEAHRQESDHLLEDERRKHADEMAAEIAKVKAEHELDIARIKRELVDEMASAMSTAEAARRIETLSERMDRSSKLVDDMQQRLEDDRNHSLRVRARDVKDVARCILFEVEG